MTKSDAVLAALGQNVRKRREDKQLTQEKLAEFSGLDPTYISGIERGGCEEHVGGMMKVRDDLRQVRAESGLENAEANKLAADVKEKPGGLKLALWISASRAE